MSPLVQEHLWMGVPRRRLSSPRMHRAYHTKKNQIGHHISWQQVLRRQVGRFCGVQIIVHRAGISCRRTHFAFPLYTRPSCSDIVSSGQHACYTLAKPRLSASLTTPANTNKSRERELHHVCNGIYLLRTSMPPCSLLCTRAFYT